VWNYRLVESPPQQANSCSTQRGLRWQRTALWVAYQGRADDLSKERRAFRLPFVIAVGVFSLILVVTEIALGGAIAPAPVGIVHVATIVGLALASALRLVALRSDELLAPSPPAEPAPALSREDDVDSGALAAQCPDGAGAGLAPGGPYRRQAPGTAGAAEYRLRRLINKGLGHRNFAAYLNGYRIEAAKAALRDPAKRRLPSSPSPSIYDRRNRVGAGLLFPMACSLQADLAIELRRHGQGFGKLPPALFLRQHTTMDGDPRVEARLHGLEREDFGTGARILDPLREVGGKRGHEGGINTRVLRAAIWRSVETA
jgi:hypothetical protein